MRNNIHYITSRLFDSKYINYGFFTKLGGLSNNPFNSLNCSKTSGDNKIKVKKNIILALTSLGLSNQNLIIGKQIHSNKVIYLKKNYNLNKILTADGFITQNKNLVLGILTADCAPIFFHDSINNTIAAAHAGWKGCLKNICESVINSMKKVNCKSKNIKAIIGPCINLKNYEVDKKFYIEFLKKNKNYDSFFIYNKLKKNYTFDLASTLEYQLKKLSIKKVIMKNIDTYSNNHKFFSHRRVMKKNIKTGRMINIIGFSQYYINKI